jgi:asparaginyl-tRNA synthetase
MSFIDIAEILKGRTGKVSIRGWLHNKRSSGGVAFWILRDGTGFIQCTLRKNILKNFEELEKLPRESVVEISGDAREEKRAEGGYEVAVSDVKVISKAEEDFPIGKKYHGPEFLLNNRHFWLRSKKMFAITRIRSKFLQAAREWFEKNGFTEVHVPIIVGAAVEGGATLFELNYFGKPAYLTQSWQLYGEAYIASVGKCYTIAPSFRAEKSRTRRHLTEYWHLEAEIPFCNLEQLMKIEEELVSFAVQKVAKESAEDLKVLGRDPKDLLKVKPPFKRITYDEAIKILQEAGVKISWGQDMGADEERVLANKFDLPFFVTHFPKGIKAFYHKPDEKNPKVTLSVDLLAPEGYGEITGGGQRIHDYNELLQRIKEEKLNPKDYEWYLQLRRWGTVEHSGFGLGVERTVMWMCKLKHIRDAIAFPRLINRVYP